MDRDTLIHVVQVKVLKKYKLLVDCSGLEDHVLQRLSKRMPSVETEGLTFANWCEQIFGEGARVQVARFGDVTGNKHLKTLTDDPRPVENLRRQEKVHNAQLKAVEQAIVDAEPEQTVVVERAPEPALEKDHFSLGLRHWYGDIDRQLQRLLPGITEVDGPIFNDEGQKNRQHRAQLAEVVHAALLELEYLGLEVFVELEDVRKTNELVPNITVHQTPTATGEREVRTLFSFTVAEMPIDILKAMGKASYDLDHEIAAMTCHVSVSGEREGDGLDDEISHLSYLMHKLFITLAKSADYRPRANLREKILLSLMLCWTAPCMPLKQRRHPLPLLYRPDDGQAHYERLRKPIAPDVRLARSFGTCMTWCTRTMGFDWGRRCSGGVRSQERTPPSRLTHPKDGRRSHP